MSNDIVEWRTFLVNANHHRPSPARFTHPTGHCTDQSTATSFDGCSWRLISCKLRAIANTPRTVSRESFLVALCINTVVTPRVDNYSTIIAKYNSYAERLCKKMLSPMLSCQVHVVFTVTSIVHNAPNAQ